MGGIHQTSYKQKRRNHDNLWVDKLGSTTPHKTTSVCGKSGATGRPEVEQAVARMATNAWARKATRKTHENMDR